MLIIHDNLWKYVLIYLSPMLILLLIQLLQVWANSNFIWENVDPSVEDIPPIPKCYGEDCLTLAYAINGEDHPYINHTIQHIKQANNLSDDQVQKWNTNIQQTLKKL